MPKSQNIRKNLKIAIYVTKISKISGKEFREVVIENMYVNVWSINSRQQFPWFRRVIYNIQIFSRQSATTAIQSIINSW